MSRSVRVFQVDAFSSQRFCGNPAGVVLDADALSDADMQSLARELNNGDTVFLLSPDGSDHDVRARFFTPRREAAFVGHATLAAHAVLAQLGLPPRPRQKQSSGIVTISTQGGVPARIAISQSPPPLGRALTSAELDAILAALSLGREHLDPSCPPVLAGPATRVLLGVRNPEALEHIRPDFARLAALSAQIAAVGYFLFALLGSPSRRTTTARMFCPALGIPEDPVSGNAHAMLGVYLLHHRLIMPEAAGFEGEQGRHMGRPGRVSVLFERNLSGLSSIAISGEATIVFATSVEFP
jgi:PhzF family phenazine biosynthesis protein